MNMSQTSISNEHLLNTENVWNAWRNNLYAFIFKRVKDPFIAEDILQEVFLKIHLHLQQLQSIRKLEAWVFQIARNQLKDHFKRQQKELKLFDSPQKNIDNYQEDEREWLCCFDPFVESLPEKYKIVIRLIHQQGKKQREVAKLLDISLANVKSRVYRAKEMLKERFIQCCKFTLNDEGKLVGELVCEKCDHYI